MSSSKRYRSADKAYKYRYYWCLLATFLGYFGLGILFSWFQSAVPVLRLALPVQMNALFSREIPLSPLRDWWADALILASMQTAPAAILFVLGLRAADFFCLSRIWNLIYFALHGVMFHRFLLLFLYGFQVASALSRILLCIFLLLFCLSLSTLCLVFLRINRTSAKGILIPCFGINRYFYPNMSNQPQSSRTLQNYLRAAFRCIATVFVGEVILIFLSYGLRKYIAVFVSNV